MRIDARVKDLGFGVVGLAMMMGVAAIGIGSIVGAEASSVWLLRWIFPTFLIALLISIVLLTPLSLIPSTRALSAVGFIIASFAFGAILCIWGMAYTYSVWGLVPVIVGVLLFGVGVVPVAMIAALVQADWDTLGAFVAAAVVAIGCRALASWLVRNADERAAHLYRFDIAVRPNEIREWRRPNGPARMRPINRGTGPEFRWAALACAAVLALAPVHWPYGYYQFLRLAVTALAIWLAISASRQQNATWTIVGVGLALLYNPIIPIYLNRATWLPIDLVATAVCVAAAIRLPRPLGHPKP